MSPTLQFDRCLCLSSSYVHRDNIPAFYTNLPLPFVKIKATVNWFLHTFHRFRISRQVKIVNFSITIEIWRFGRPAARTCQTTDVLCVAQNTPHEPALRNPACKWNHTENPKGFRIFFHIYNGRVWTENYDLYAFEYRIQNLSILNLIPRSYDPSFINTYWAPWHSSRLY